MCLLGPGAIGQVTENERRPDYWLERGYLAYNNGMYSDARRNLSEALGMMPDEQSEPYIRARFYESQAALGLLNKDAEALVREFVRNYPTHPLKNRAVLSLADYHFNFKRYQAAAEWYGQVDRYLLEKNQLDVFQFRHGYALFSEKRFTEAKPLFQQVKDRGSAEYAIPATYYLGHMQYEEGFYDNAKVTFESLKGDSSFGAVVPFYLAQIYYKSGDYEGLNREAASLLSFPNVQREAEITRLLAEAAFRKGKYKEVLSYFDRYRELNGVFGTDENYEAGYAAYQLKNYPLAVTYLSQIADGSTATAQNAWFHLGLSHLAQGHKEQALTAFSAASALDFNPQIREEAEWSKVKLIYETGGALSDGVLALEAFLERYPDSPHRKEVQALLANMMVQTRDYDRALVLMQRVGVETPAAQETYQRIAYVRGVEFFQTRAYDEALDKWTESLRYPMNMTLKALAHFWSAEAHYRLGHYDQVQPAINQFREVPGAFKMSEFPRSYFLEGYAHFKQRNYTAAAAAFRRFADDDAEKDKALKADALLRAADAYFLTGGYVVAAGLYDDAASSTSPDADYALFQSALCKGLVRKNDDKVQRLKKLLNKYPQSRLAPEARFELGNTYLELGQFDLALEAFNALESTPGTRFQASAKVKKGLIYRNQRKYDQALGLFKGVVADYPGTSEANEAQAFAKLTYLSLGQADAYASWVESLGLADAKRGELDTLLFTSAYESYLQGDFEAAAKGFEQYQSRFKNGQYYQKSQFYLAETYYQLNNPAAEGLYAALGAWPENEYSVTTWERLADLRYKKKDYAGAYQAFGKLLEVADSRQREIKARIGLLECAAQLQLDEEVVNLADALAQGDGLSAEQIVRGRILKARSLEKLKWEPQSTAAWESLKRAENPAYQAEARYRLLERLYAQGSWNQAIDDGFALIEQLPGQSEWKNKALLLMARCYEALNDLFQANYTLDFLINNNPSSAVANEAQALKAEMQAREAEKKAALEAQKSLQNLVLPTDQLNEPGMDDENETP